MGTSRWPWPGGALVVAVVCLLLVLAVDRIARGIAAIQLPVEAMYGEAIIYDQASRLARGEALYQPLNRPPFTVTAYTPLYYALVSVLQWLGGIGFGPGRVVSFGAGIASAIVVGRLATRRTHDRRAGLFAALLFVALGFPGDYPWFAFYKEDMLGAAMSLCAIAVLDGGTDRRRAVSAGGLAGLAFLSKQALVAAGVAGFAWLWGRNKTSAVAFAATFAVIGAGPCLVLAVSNDAFLDNTVRANLNPARTDILLSNLAIVGQYQGVVLALTLLPIVSGALPFRRWLQDPLVAFWLVSMVLLPVGLAKVGSNWNYWIEWAAASAVLGTRGVWLLVLEGGAPGFGRIAASGALLALLASPRWLPPPADNLGTVLDRTLHPDQRQAAEFAQVLERVRSEPRGVLAEPLDIVTLANREILMEPFIFSILNSEGEWDASPVVRQICGGQIGLLVLDHPLDGSVWQTHDYFHWPLPVLYALRASMRLEAETARLYLYVPIEAFGGPQPSAALSEACRGAT
jgi:hypothetical protein